MGRKLAEYIRHTPAIHKDIDTIVIIERINEKLIPWKLKKESRKRTKDADQVKRKENKRYHIKTKIKNRISFRAGNCYLDVFKR